MFAILSHTTPKGWEKFGSSCMLWSSKYAAKDVNKITDSKFPMMELAYENG